MTDINTIHKYFKARVKEIKCISKKVNPWGFVCCSAFIEYLVKATNGGESGREKYKDFIIKYLSQIDDRYTNFKYHDGKQDLPVQMYHILRCGIIHSFSFVPDNLALGNGGRIRSILLSHKDVHLTPYTEKEYDSVIFNAMSFANDIEKLVDLIFNDIAEKDDTVKKNILQWYEKYPPICALQTTEKSTALKAYLIHIRDFFSLNKIKRKS